ncbi:MAG: tRNA (adenosine(37)-N6)-threonylcarbamoyltransferase complex ATPase subunit type 1 TsaE [Sphaerochaeta sp.]|jgi:tRNA threonylcarbamoyladenosine biosynthesis protein TsaE
MQFISHSSEETKEFGKKFAENLKPGAVISLRGSLGAGKTVIAKGIAEYLNIKEAIVSPTFTILQEYNGDLPLYHMDLYRISGCDEFEMMGGEEMLYGEGITLIEWSEKIDEMLPEDTIYLELTILENQDRVIDITGLED